MSDGTLEDAETIDVVVGTTNRAPVATAQSVTTAEDSATAITLAATDPDGESLTFTVVSQPAHGTLSGTAPALTYTPDPTTPARQLHVHRLRRRPDVRPRDGVHHGHPGRRRAGSVDDAYGAVEDSTLVVGPAQGVLAERRSTSTATA